MSTNKNKKYLNQFFNSFSSFKKVLIKKENQELSPKLNEKNLFDSKKYLDENSNDDLSIGYNIDNSENSYYENEKESENSAVEYLKVSETGSVKNITLDSFKKGVNPPNKEELLKELNRMFYNEPNKLEMEYLEISRGRKTEETIIK
tara:strand:- start:53 stop:493 length:441 start_codon:yes stop_codon:yes gene_type:complete